MNTPPIPDSVVQLPKKKARVVLDAIEALGRSQVLDAATAEKIRSSIHALPFDWRRLARYSFIVALTCIVIAIGAAIADEWLMQLLARLFKMPWSFKSVSCAVVSAGLFVLGLKRRRLHPTRIYSNEAIFFCGVLGIAGSIACLGKAIDNGSGHYSLLVLLAALIYGVLGIALESKLIWGFSLLSLGGWFGAETGYMSGWGAYYLGMAFPMRFVLFGLVLTLASLLMPGRSRFAEFFGLTRVVGLLYLFIALWILSIWGNYQGYGDWHRASHWELFHWSVYFGLASALAIYLGLRDDDSVLRGFGLTFLGINLYTRFFEYCWDGLHKAVFFAILGLSFWLLGSRAESIWRMRSLKKQLPPNAT
jgi:hypothetical protein